MWSDLNPVMTGWLADLRAAGFKTAVLSNMHPDMAVHVRRSFDWLRRLDSVTLSCEVRLIKPDPAIYQRCLGDLGVPPAAACFIDDREANVAAAREAGLTAFRFETAELLRAGMVEFGFECPP